MSLLSLRPLRETKGYFNRNCELPTANCRLCTRGPTEFDHFMTIPVKKNQTLCHILNCSEMNLKTPIARLRLLAILEGISYLLFAVTMPLKYMMDIPEPNYFVGMAHGVLFIFYVLACMHCIFLYKWNLKISFLAQLASLIPFGTFIADARIFKPEQARADHGLT